MSRGFGVLQRAVLLAVADAMLPDNSLGPSSTWWSAKDLALLLSNPLGPTAGWQNWEDLMRAPKRPRNSVRRAVHRLAEDGHLEIAHTTSDVDYHVGDERWVSTTRQMLFVRVPPVRRDGALSMPEGSELSDHFAGLAETTGSYLEQRVQFFRVRDSQPSPELWARTLAGWDLVQAQLVRRIRYHRQQLNRVPVPDFAWQWTFARWIAHRRALGDERIPPHPWLSTGWLPAGDLLE